MANEVAILYVARSQGVAYTRWLPSSPPVSNARNIAKRRPTPNNPLKPRRWPAPQTMATSSARVIRVGGRNGSPQAMRPSRAASASNKADTSPGSACKPACRSRQLSSSKASTPIRAGISRIRIIPMPPVRTCPAKTASGRVITMEDHSRKRIRDLAWSAWRPRVRNQIPTRETSTAGRLVRGRTNVSSMAPLRLMNASFRS